MNGSINQMAKPVGRKIQNDGLRLQSETRTKAETEGLKVESGGVKYRQVAESLLEWSEHLTLKRGDKVFWK